MATQKLMSVRDISQLLGVSNQAVHMYITSNRLPATQDKSENDYRPPYKVSSNDLDSFLRTRVKEYREKASKLEGFIGKAGR